MRLIGLAVVLAGSFVLTPLAPDAQQAASVYQIGLLTLGSDPTRSEFWQKFLQAMHELNYVEGRNLIVRRAFADGKADRLPGLVADLVQAKVDVIVTTSTQETAAAKRASSTIPIVMTVAPDPVEQGLVASLAQPGGNVTGLTSMAPGASQKFVELLRETVPSASRFAVLATVPTLRPVKSATSCRPLRDRSASPCRSSRSKTPMIWIRPSREQRSTVQEASSLLSAPSPMRTGQSWCISPSSIDCLGSIGFATM